MRVVCVAATLCVCASALHAQVSVGELKDTRTLAATAVCTEIRPGGMNQVRIARQNNTFNAGPGTQVFLTDGLSKQSDVLARLEVSERRGTFYLVPTIACYPELKGRRYAGEIPHSVSSEYRFATRNVLHRGARVPSLALLLDRGAVIVHWNGGNKAPLAVILPFDSLDVIGTKVAISVDAAGTGGFVYVHEGTIVLRSTQQTLTAGQTVQWPGATVTPASGGVDIEPLRLTTRYYTDGAWGSRLGWLKWGVPLAVGGAVVAVVTLWPDDDIPARRGTVIIRLPWRR